MKKIKEQQYQYMMTVLAVITMVLVIGIYMTEQRENEKLMVVTSKDYIKWVDYQVSAEAMKKACRLDVENLANIINIIGFELDREDILMICMDRFMNVKSITNITEQSGPRYAYTSTEKIFRTATMSGAKYVMLVHNHPDEKREISHDDIEMTLHVDNMLHAMDIMLVDHMVICGKDVLSIKSRVIKEEMQKAQENLPEDMYYEFEGPF